MFLFQSIDQQDAFTPEEFTPEHRQIGKAIEDFIKGEISGREEEIESHNFALSRELMATCGDLGFLGIDIPEEYDGMALDKVSSALVSEKLGYGAGSFALTELNHTGIGTLPVALFGTEEQKKKYLPGLTTGRLIGAFGLTEPEAGSDALNSLSTAVLSEDGRHYLLNGTKQFITNAGFADIVFAYAKVDGKHFTAFIVEQNWEGVSTGPEEEKMGWHGTSTRPYHFDNVKVPVENVLGQVGKGHVVALNALNMGRFKVGAICIGHAKRAFYEAVQYAKKRKQFGSPICRFGLIREKIAKTAIRIFAAETMMYRTAGLIQSRIDRLCHESSQSLSNTAAALKDYIIECSINKVFGSETEGYVVDEEVQIFGGYSYIRGHHPEMAYRHARPNRIWEGTNEINRIVILSTLFKKLDAAGFHPSNEPEALLADVKGHFQAAGGSKNDLSALKSILAAAKSVASRAVSVACERLGSTVRDEQQAVIGLLADLIIDIYAMESMWLRCRKMGRESSKQQKISLAMARAYFAQALGRLAGAAFEIFGALEGTENSGALIRSLEALSFGYPIDQVAVREMIAAQMIKKGRYSI